jgi:hypothetical protein
MSRQLIPVSGFNILSEQSSQLLTFLARHFGFVR